MYFGEAFCGAFPEYSDLYPEILDYAYRELKDENGLGVSICDDNTAQIKAAQAPNIIKLSNRTLTRSGCPVFLKNF